MRSWQGGLLAIAIMIVVGVILRGDVLWAWGLLWTGVFIGALTRWEDR